jgi:alpha-galactosidase
MKLYLFMLLSLYCIILQAQKFQGLAPTPPMGWNSWNTFETKINEKLVKETADAFVTLGLKDAGYEYLVLDDGWMAKKRDDRENIVADPEKFPEGIKALADYVHAKGLKFGLYSCAGALTCAGYPGGRGHEYQDALTYASWGVDFLKYDWCHTDNLKAEGAYTTMRDALYAAGRPVTFSICEWGDNQPWLWAKNIGHLWRTSGDITNCWDCEVDHGTWSSWGIMRILNMRRNTRQYAGPGHWNDLDMLEVGNGLTHAENKAHFALWSMVAAPLILGNDLRNTTHETLKIITNKEIIAVDQDVLGIQGFKYSDKDGLEIWAKPLAENAWAICFLNRKEDAYALEFNWQKHDISDTLFHQKINMGKIYTIRDLYKKTIVGTTKNILKSEIPAHDVLILKLTQE